MPEALKLEAPSFYETALVPSNKFSPSYTKNTMMGALAGGALCAGFFTLLFLINDSITTPDDMLKYTGFQPLTTIYEIESANSRKGKKKEQPSMAADDESGKQLEALLNQKIRESEQTKDGDSK